MANETWQPELDLLPPDPWAGEALEVPSGAMLPAQAKLDSESTGAGRPTGAGNKRADDLTDYIARRYGSPLEHLGRLQMKSVTELMQEMGVSGSVAMLHWLNIRRMLARFTVRAPPKAVLMAARVNDGFGTLHYEAALRFSNQMLAETTDHSAAKPEASSRDLVDGNVVRLELPPKGED